METSSRCHPFDEQCGACSTSTTQALSQCRRGGGLIRRCQSLIPSSYRQVARCDMFETLPCRCCVIRGPSQEKIDRARTAHHLPTLRDIGFQRRQRTGPTVSDAKVLKKIGFRDDLQHHP